MIIIQTRVAKCKRDNFVLRHATEDTSNDYDVSSVSQQA